MKRTKHRRRSRVETELPIHVRDQVNRLLLEGATYDDIERFCKAEGYDISRSSIGRYGKDYFEAYQKVKRFEDQSKALISGAGEALSMDEAIAKLLQQKVLEAAIDGSLDILDLPRILSDVARLQMSNVAREKIKADLADKAKKALANIEKKTSAKKKSLDPETLKIIREEVYGIV